MTRLKLLLLIVALLISLITIQSSRFSATINSLVLEWIMVLSLLGFLILAFSLGFRSYRKNHLKKAYRSSEELSSREMEILSLMAEGLSNKEIGQALFISESTVKKHSSNIFSKLKVSRRTQAVRIAYDLGLVLK
ncbi:MAG: response regulator transcription factor [Cyclobacteriaceae bacterium]